MRAPLRLGPYLVVRELARGGMGVVHEALHEPTGARHALKTLLPGAEPDEVARFRREAELLGRLDHPNVVRVHAADLAGRPPWLALELLTGGSLQDRLAHGPLAPEEALALGATLARALAHAHARGVLHRDLKPSNVVFDERGEPRLVDFGLGLAAAGGQRLTRTGSVLGTPAFMAPEQAEGLKAEDERTDVHGLGVLLYAALAGRPPFEGSHLAVLQAVLEGAPTPLGRLRPGLPPALVAVVERAMAWKPEDRFASAEALAAALEAASSRGLRGRRSRAGVLLLAGLVLAGGAAWLAGRDAPGGPAATPPPPRPTPRPTAPLAPVEAPASTTDPQTAIAAAREALRLDDLRGLEAALGALGGRAPPALVDEVVARAITDERLPSSFLLAAALRQQDAAATAAVKRACAYLGCLRRAAPDLSLVERPELRDLFISLVGLKEPPFVPLHEELARLLPGEPAIEFTLARCRKDADGILAALELTERAAGPPGPFTAILRGEILFAAHHPLREREPGRQALRPRIEREVARSARGEPVSARARLLLADMLIERVPDPLPPDALEAARRASAEADDLIAAASEQARTGAETLLLGTYRAEVLERAERLRARIDQADRRPGEPRPGAPR